MHELALAQSIVEIASEVATAHGAARLASIEVVVGAYAGGADQALRTCFAIAAVGTPCEEADLVVTFLPVDLWCWDCAHGTPVPTPVPETCPRCGSGRIVARGERSFTVVSVDILEGEPCASPC